MSIQALQNATGPKEQYVGPAVTKLTGFARRTLLPTERQPRVRSPQKS
jgi:hypothetical protein